MLSPYSVKPIQCKGLQGAKSPRHCGIRMAVTGCVNGSLLTCVWGVCQTPPAGDFGEVECVCDAGFRSGNLVLSQQHCDLPEMALTVYLASMLTLQSGFLVVGLLERSRAKRSMRSILGYCVLHNLSNMGIHLVWAANDGSWHPVIIAPTCCSIFFGLQQLSAQLQANLRVAAAQQQQQAMVGLQRTRLKRILKRKAVIASCLVGVPLTIISALFFDSAQSGADREARDKFNLLQLSILQLVILLLVDVGIQINRSATSILTVLDAKVSSVATGSADAAVMREFKGRILKFKRIFRFFVAGACGMSTTTFVIFFALHRVKPFSWLDATSFCLAEALGVTLPPLLLAKRSTKRRPRQGRPAAVGPSNHSATASAAAMAETALASKAVSTSYHDASPSCDK